MAERHELFQRDCQKCGCPLAFIESAEGKLIPLDLRAPVYQVIDIKKQDGSLRRQAVRTHMAFVSHFSTCRFADEFSKK